MKEESILFKTKEVLSFDCERDLYDLEKIDFHSSRKIITFMERLKKLEKENKIRIVMRGFSIKDDSNRYSQNLHNKFKEEELNRFFVVGQKAADYFRAEEATYTQLYNGNFEDKEVLIHEINNMYKEATEILHLKTGIEGELSRHLIKIDTTTPFNQLIYNRLFLTAFLHNVGNKWSGKISTPFISAAYGKNKKETAIKFATNNRRGQPENAGYILLGYMPTENLKFEKLTTDLNDELKRLGLIWYEDIHKEILFLDGIMPHRVIGIFEIENHREEYFILNPWLHKMFKHNIRFNYRDGINIDQRNFEAFAENLGYRGYILETKNDRYNKLFEAEKFKRISGFEIKKTEE